MLFFVTSYLLMSDRLTRILVEAYLGTSQESAIEFFVKIVQC